MTDAKTAERPYYGVTFEKKTITVLDADAALVYEALRLCIKFMPFPGTYHQQKAVTTAQRALATLRREK